jgi:hypothetical protein
MKPKLLVLELWRVGDLAISTPFLQAASQQFEVTLLAQPVAQSLQTRFFPSVKVVPFVAPWTVFHHKYRLGAVMDEILKCASTAGERVRSFRALGYTGAFFDEVLWRKPAAGISETRQPGFPDPIVEATFAAGASVRRLVGGSASDRVGNPRAQRATGSAGA